MSTKTYYVYELWNPITSEIFYVGKGTKRSNGYYRLREHIKDTRYYKAGKYKKNHKYCTIAKILDARQIPQIKVVFECFDEIAAIEKEIELIARYGRRDNGTGPLTNHTDGGECMQGYKHSIRHRTRLKIDNPGGKATAIPIVAINPHTNKIEFEFESSNAAAIALTGKSFSKGNINSCCRKRKNRIAHGYYWRYKSEYNENEDFHTITHNRTNKSLRSSKPITQLDLEGKQIKVWESASEICRHYGLSVGAMHRYIKQSIPYRDYLWVKS